MWNLWRLLGAQRCIFPTSVHMSLCFSNSFESLEPKNTIVPRHFSVGCYTGVCRSSPPLSWSVCESVSEYMATSFSRATGNCHIRWVCLCVAKPVKLGDTQARSDFFWPISRPNLIGGLWSIFNSLYHQCHSSSAQLCPFHLAHSTVGWQSFEKPLSVFFSWQMVRPWRRVPFPLCESEIPSAHVLPLYSFLLLLLLVRLSMTGLVSSLRDLSFGSLD